MFDVKFTSTARKSIYRHHPDVEFDYLSQHTLVEGVIVATVGYGAYKDSTDVHNLIRTRRWILSEPHSGEHTLRPLPLASPPRQRRRRNAVYSHRARTLPASDDEILSSAIMILTLLVSSPRANVPLLAPLKEFEALLVEDELRAGRDADSDGRRRARGVSVVLKVRSL
ncbi:hypothetical protein CPB85DRAFT_549725 [Mucidula mucida]|nr:hypothetical protein CPB85DRAFT_549725 [Mucidula mucida]